MRARVGVDRAAARARRRLADVVRDLAGRYSLAEIGAELGTTKQAVHDLLKRQRNPSGGDGITENGLTTANPENMLTP